MKKMLIAGVAAAALTLGVSTNAEANKDSDVLGLCVVEQQAAMRSCSDERHDFGQELLHENDVLHRTVNA